MTRDWRDHIRYRCLIGSRAYGLETEGSDHDVRGFFLPPVTRYLGLHEIPEQLETKQPDEVYWELGKLVRLALKANPTVLEVLYTPIVYQCDGVGEELRALRDSFLSRRAATTYLGYATQQFDRCERALRNGDDRLKGKHAMHLLRLLYTGGRLLEEGTLTLDISEHRDLLLDVRAGRIPWDEVLALRVLWTELFRDAEARSLLPEHPDEEAADRFLIRARLMA